MLRLNRFWEILKRKLIKARMLHKEMLATLFWISMRIHSERFLGDGSNWNDIWAVCLTVCKQLERTSIRQIITSVCVSLSGIIQMFATKQPSFWRTISACHWPQKRRWSSWWPPPSPHDRSWSYWWSTCKRTSPLWSVKRKNTFRKGLDSLIRGSIRQRAWNKSHFTWV